MTFPSPLDTTCINAIRFLAVDAIQKANSGHPGLPLGAAPMAYVLWRNHLKVNPKDPNWHDRDRFVLSAGHGSMLLYALLHLSGYDLSMDDIEAFRQWGSRTPGHPENHITPGVETTTGPLGQGFANAVGMAVAERHLSHLFGGDEQVDHHTYVLAGDGCLMEGIVAEAASLAGHLRLGKLIVLYDANDISLDGPLNLSFSEEIGQRYESCGWQVLHVANGDTDLEAIDAAILDAKRDSSRPSLVVVKSTIGFGSPSKQGTASAHGAPLGSDEVTRTRATLDWPHQAFEIPAEVYDHFSATRERGKMAQHQWQMRLDAWRAGHPDDARAWDLAMNGDLPENWKEGLPTWNTGDKVATRNASGAILNAIAERIPNFLGGDADLSCSTKTAIKGAQSFEGQGGTGRNIHYGVREHAMGAVANGMVHHGGVNTYTATFFCFADYMRPAMRLAALSDIAPIYVFTHDSVAVGEDGPTHQPVEHLASLRAMPNMLVIRPADAEEAREAWVVAMEQKKRPCTLVFSRQGLPVLPRSESVTNLRRGAYIVKDAKRVEITLLATGSEVSLAFDAALRLESEGIGARVVSFPCWELFEQQSPEYQRHVLSGDAPIVAIEAGSSMGWHRWIGSKGAILAIDRFGASAPGDQVLSKLGFHVDGVVALVKRTLNP